MTNPQRILRLKDVKNQTGLGRSSIYSYAQQGLFPKPVKIGARSVGWVEAEVQEWIAARVAAK